MSIKDNLSFKKNPVTSVMGFVFLFVSLFILVLPMVYEVKEKPEGYITMGIGLIGMLLLLAPDKAIGITHKILDKKAENI